MKQEKIQFHVQHNLKKLRAEHGITQTQLAIILDVSRARIGAWEECRATPCAEHLLSICHNFNIELKTFLTTLL